MTPPTRESGINPPDSKEPGAQPRVPLRTVAAIFLRLGATSFGGPAAHIALMEDEFVRHRGWLTHDEFLDLLGATNLIPGPNSTEMAIHIGHRVAGWRGLLVAGACFTLPALLIVTALAWVYVCYRQLPAVAAVLYCIKPVVIAVVVQALWRLAPRFYPRAVAGGRGGRGDIACVTWGSRTGGAVRRRARRAPLEGTVP